MRLPRYVPWSCALGLLLPACGGSPSAAPSATTPVTLPPAAEPSELLSLVPASPLAVLRVDLEVVRTSDRYDWFAAELERELHLEDLRDTLRGLLDRADEGLGVVLRGEGPQDGVLVVRGRFTAEDFAEARRIASSRHDGAAQTMEGAEGGVLVVYGEATLARLGDRALAVGQGPAARAFLSQAFLSQASLSQASLSRADLGGPHAFSEDLAEFGQRVGLPRGAAQAWASQTTPVGQDLVGLVMAGDRPQMVRDFVSTVSRHLGF